MPCAPAATTQPSAKPLFADMPRMAYAAGMSSHNAATSSAPADAACTCVRM